MCWWTQAQSVPRARPAGQTHSKSQVGSFAAANQRALGPGLWMLMGVLPPSPRSSEETALKPKVLLWLVHQMKLMRMLRKVQKKTYRLFGQKDSSLAREAVDEVDENTDSRTGFPEFEFWLCHFPAVWPFANYLASLCLSFLLLKMAVIVLDQLGVEVR